MIVRSPSTRSCVAHLGRDCDLIVTLRRERAQESPFDAHAVADDAEDVFTPSELAPFGEDGTHVRFGGRVEWHCRLEEAREVERAREGGLPAPIAHGLLARHLRDVFALPRARRERVEIARVVFVAHARQDRRRTGRRSLENGVNARFGGNRRRDVGSGDRGRRRARCAHETERRGHRGDAYDRARP